MTRREKRRNQNLLNLQRRVDRFLACQRHAESRFLERYGRELEEGQYDALCELVKTDKSIAFRGANNFKTEHVIKIGSEFIAAIWDGNMIVTFLPKENVNSIMFLAIPHKA